MPDNFNAVDRAELVENDFVDWVGKSGTVIRPSNGNNRFDSTNGTFVTIKNPAKVKLAHQRNWQGNFNEGDRLIYTSSDDPRPIGLLLNRPIRGVGFQIQVNGFEENGDPLRFDGILRAFGDEAKTIELGYCCFTGQSDDVVGNARFLGVIDPNASITYLEVETRLFDNQREVGFAINKLLLQL